MIIFRCFVNNPIKITLLLFYLKNIVRKFFANFDSDICCYDDSNISHYRYSHSSITHSFKWHLLTFSVKTQRFLKSINVHSVQNSYSCPQNFEGQFFLLPQRPQDVVSHPDASMRSVFTMETTPASKIIAHSRVILSQLL